MIWHIFKKDCRLALPFILVVALFQVANAVWLTVLDPFSSTQPGLFFWSNMLSVALLIGLVVHQDEVPGDAQDWFVRPISRGQLLAAKLLFVLVAIHAPIFVVDMVSAVGQGFAFAQSLGAALSRNIAIALAISLPSLVLAVVTRNLGGMFLGVLLIVTSWVVLGLVRNDFQSTQLRWLDDISSYAIVLITAGIVLPLQYFRRRTFYAIAIVCIAVLLKPLASSLPWQSEYAIQRGWFARRDSASALSMQFAPEAKVRGENFGGMNFMGLVAVSLPIRIAQLPRDSELVFDNAAVRIYDARGAILHRSEGCVRRFDVSGGIGYCSRSDFRSSAIEPAQRILHYDLHLPQHVYDRIKEQAVRVEMEYSGTLFGVSGSYDLPANASNVLVPEIGRCSTHPSLFAERIVLRCRTASRAVPCLSLAETSSSGAATRTLCPFDYDPYLPRMLPGVLTSFGDSIVPDPPGRYARNLLDRRLAIRAYRLDKHWTGGVIIPSIRLAEWAFEGPPVY